MVFWKAPDFSAGAVKPVNMIDEERDTCPALLALYYPFVWDAHFPGFQSEKYTYRFLGFCVVLTALSRLRWCTRQPISRGSLGVQWLMFSCFIHALTRSLAAFSRLHQDGDFSLFALCSTAFLIVANGIFSSLCRHFAFAGLACLGEQERDVSRSIFPERFVE